MYPALSLSVCQEKNDEGQLQNLVTTPDVVPWPICCSAAAFAALFLLPLLCHHKYILAAQIDNKNKHMTMIQDWYYIQDRPISSQPTFSIRGCCMHCWEFWVPVQFVFNETAIGRFFKRAA